MSDTTAWTLPPSTLHWLGQVPPGEAGYMLPITETGEQLARQLGALFSERLQSLRTSPLVRCLQTAEALRNGAAKDLSITKDRLLGDPGVFVLDGKRAWSNWQAHGHEFVMQQLARVPVWCTGAPVVEKEARREI